jgi:hypothetical protein
MVRQLVNDGRRDLPLELVGVREVLFEREPKEADLVRDDGPVGCPFSARYTLVQTVERLVPFHSLAGELLAGWLVLDDDRDLFEMAGKRLRDGCEGSGDELLEASPPPSGPTTASMADA